MRFTAIVPKVQPSGDGVAPGIIRVTPDPDLVTLAMRERTGAQSAGRVGCVPASKISRADPITEIPAPSVASINLTATYEKVLTPYSKGERVSFAP